MLEGTNKGQNQVWRTFIKVYTTFTSIFKNVINMEARGMLQVYIPNKTLSPVMAPEMTKKSQFLTLQTPYRSEQ